jgi:hypothetical protein
VTDSCSRLVARRSSSPTSLFSPPVIDAEGFETLAGLCPSLQKLHLSLCGQMQSSSLLALAKLQHLRRLELYAPFLVRKEAWAEFFERMGKRAGGGLEGLLIRNSPRMDEAALEALVEYNPGLTELRLSLVEKCACHPREYIYQRGVADASSPLAVAESWLDKIAWLRNLTLLDISYPAKSLDGTTAVGGAPQPGGGAAAEGGLMSTAIDAAVTPPAEGSAEHLAQEERQAAVDHSAHSVVNVLAALGPNLTHLSLAGHSFLTADVLAEGIGKHCPNLTHLDLSDLPLLTDDETSAFIAAWAPVGLVDVRRRWRRCSRSKASSRRSTLPVGRTATRKSSGRSAARRVAACASSTSAGAVRSGSASSGLVRALADSHSLCCCPQAT